MWEDKVVTGYLTALAVDKIKFSVRVLWWALVNTVMNLRIK
jgi:hypothetical protein